ncbi:predicted protein [Plenodomus lingam JN3]|uniref:Predicted protein n=1 Tax=Leptosphaeria maculans (strain JN3 / isolate v23.1.3 / race Av1-4-5-6-7-8) TaxID=985895 RepID=E4ZW89_LEPMJ|nr:predicted protein [Plenodomus lingam JN3]CBX95865.1 predicted protein [Plenodomus lingam JN3]
MSLPATTSANNPMATGRVVVAATTTTTRIPRPCHGLLPVSCSRSRRTDGAIIAV